MTIDWQSYRIDWDLFHFLRPEWLWLFIPMLVVILIVIISNRGKNAWKKIIAPHLRSYMFTKENKGAVVYPLLFMMLSFTFMILSATGPTWKRVEVPGAKTEAVLYIALDMSRSMTATDVQPNRLERAKFKIKDLLEAKPKARTGLMVFAGTAHPVISVCEDYNLILNQIESLTPYIMPRAGSNYQYAFDLIDTVMSRVEAPSTLLFITDEIDESKAQYFINFVEQYPHRIELMSLATSQGSKVPGWRKGTFFKEASGEYHISARNDIVMNQLAQHPKITMTPLTLDKSDVEGIAERVSKKLIFKKAEEESEEEWVDMGYYLLIPIGVLMLLWFRKGFMIQLVLLLMVMACDHVKTWEDLWYSQDYQGQLLYNDSSYQASADQFESLFHKGVAMYKSGDVESAINIFEQDSLNSNSQYNLGVSYAEMGYYDQAMESFQLAADLDPGMKGLNEVIDLTNQRIMTTDSLAKLTGEPKKKLPKTNKKDEPLEERSAAGKDEELTSDTETDELPQSGKRVTDTQETGIRKAEELTEVPKDFDASQNQNQVQDILLREISADPSEFLKRKFEYQFKKYYQDDYVQGENW
ncbi:MAG: VWA domain-containing protein [Reichenbachiella sp.]